MAIGWTLARIQKEANLFFRLQRIEVFKYTVSMYKKYCIYQRSLYIFKQNFSNTQPNKYGSNRAE